MNIMSVVKEHPVPVGLGVLIILLIVFSKGSGGGSSGASANAGAYLRSQEIAANSNTQLADIANRGRIALGQQSVETNRIAAEAAIARTGMSNDLFAAIAGMGAQMSLSSDSKLLKSQQQQFAHIENLQSIAGNLDVAKSTIAAGVKVSGDKLNAQMTMQKEDNNFKLNALGQQISGQLSLVKENASSLPYLLQHAQTMQKIGGQNAATLADIQGKNAVQIASLQTEADRKAASAASRQSDWGIISDIGSTIMSFF